jgi:membrane associated rhomboid family serine protease
MAGGDVAYAAHVAGFVAGFLGAMVIGERRPPLPVEPRYPYRR